MTTVSNCITRKKNKEKIYITFGCCIRKICLPLCNKAKQNLYLQFSIYFFLVRLFFNKNCCRFFSFNYLTSMETEHTIFLDFAYAKFIWILRICIIIKRSKLRLETRPSIAIFSIFFSFASGNLLSCHSVSVYSKLNGE